MVKDQRKGTKIRERAGQLPSVGRGKHQILGVVLVSVFSLTGQDCAVFGVDEATPSSCDCLKLKIFKQLENLLQ